jgi:hypothetical protein
MTQLSPSAQKVQEALHALGFDLTVIEHAESTRTAQEAAERVGVTLGQIVKSLIFKGKVSGKPILVLTSGANRVDEKRPEAPGKDRARGCGFRPRCHGLAIAASRPRHASYEPSKKTCWLRCHSSINAQVVFELRMMIKKSGKVVQVVTAFICNQTICRKSVRASVIGPRRHFETKKPQRSNILVI